MCLCNVFVGAEAGKCSDGSFNVAIGLGAGKGSDTHPDNTGACNVSLGVCAGKCLVTGCDNVFIGSLAGECHCCGNGNTIIGHDAGKIYVVVIETFSLDNMQVKETVLLHPLTILLLDAEAVRTASSSLGSTNIAIGEGNFKSVTGLKNIAIGRGAGQVVSSGCYNSMFGMESW